MEDNNKIDNIFRSALEDAEMAPSQKSWQALASDLAVKRASRNRKKRAIWFSAAAIFLIISYTAIRFFNPSEAGRFNGNSNQETTHVDPANVPFQNSEKIETAPDQNIIP